MSDMLTLEKFEEASEIVKKVTSETKLIYSEYLSIQTGNKVLVEASPYDGIWGIKMAETDKMAQNPLKWNGFNLLGFALMEVRDVLSEVCRNEQLATLN